MNVPASSPAAGNINEVLKNVAAMNNNKVGGKRKTRRRQTRKNRKARKGTRKN